MDNELHRLTAEKAEAELARWRDRWEAGFTQYVSKDKGKPVIYCGTQVPQSVKGRRVRILLDDEALKHE